MRIEFIIARGHAAKLLEAAEKTLDGMAQGLRAVFFARSARVLVRPHRGRVDQQRVQGRLVLHGFEDALLHARGRPALETRVRRMPVAAFLGQGPPPRPVARQPEHSFHKLAVVAPAPAAIALPAPQQRC
jgi:hypothetical protein